MNESCRHFSCSIAFRRRIHRRTNCGCSGRGGNLDHSRGPSGDRCSRPFGEKLERITEFFNNEIATGKLPGAVVLIQQHGKPVYLKCFGVQDVETNVPMTSDTIFALHSMTKPITSVAAMMLIDAGKLSPADPVSKFIPGFADIKVGVSSVTPDGQTVLKLVRPDRPVTMMDLLRHTSGITYDYIGGKLIMKAYSESGLFDGRYNNKVFADRIARLPLARQPGTLWRYGHSTDVLGRIIEIVSGQTLYQFEKQHIFDPLGMTSTKFVLESADERARMAEPLPGDTILKNAETERRAHPEWESGGGGLVSSLTDYARFAQMILNGGELDGKRYLSPAAFKVDDIRPYRAGFRRCTGLLLLSRRWLRLRLWLCGTHRSGKCQTAAARFDRRTQMG